MEVSQVQYIRSIIIQIINRYLIGIWKATAKDRSIITVDYHPKKIENALKSSETKCYWNRLIKRSPHFSLPNVKLSITYCGVQLPSLRMYCIAVDVTKLLFRSFMQPTKSWKNPQMLLWKTQIHLFFLTAWVAQKTQKEELMFQNVAFRPTEWPTV